MTQATLLEDATLVVLLREHMVKVEELVLLFTLDESLNAFVLVLNTAEKGKCLFILDLYSLTYRQHTIFLFRCLHRSEHTR